MLTVIGLFAVVMLAALPSSYADSQTSVIPVDGKLNLEITTIIMTIPENNTLPWGYVSGSVNNPAEQHPVIIQFHKEGNPVHVAQVEVNSDGTYEYKFRVQNTTDGHTVNVFEGSYTVKIFKVVEVWHNTI